MNERVVLQLLRLIISLKVTWCALLFLRFTWSQSSVLSAAYKKVTSETILTLIQENGKKFS